MAPSEPEAQKPRVAAENTGLGSQYIVDGHGDQNVASSRGVQHNIRQQVNSRRESSSPNELLLNYLVLCTHTKSSSAANLLLTR